MHITGLNFDSANLIKVGTANCGVPINTIFFSFIELSQILFHIFENNERTYYQKSFLHFYSYFRYDFTFSRSQVCLGIICIKGASYNRIFPMFTPFSSVVFFSSFNFFICRILFSFGTLSMNNIPSR